MAKNKFGKFIKEQRLAKQLTINELSKNSDISNAQISRIESGDRGTPRPETIKKLSIGLDIPYSKLMEIAGYLENDILFTTIPELAQSTKKQMNKKIRTTLKESASSFINDLKNSSPSSEKELELRNNLISDFKLNDYAEFQEINNPYPGKKIIEQMNSEDKANLFSFISSKEGINDWNILSQENETVSIFDNYETEQKAKTYSAFLNEFLGASEELKNELLHYWEFIKSKHQKNN